MTKNLKTPLRYPGGKSRALTKLLKYLPETEIKEYREMFLGGGSVALEMTKRLPKGTPIWVNDLYEPLYNFWVVLRDNPVELQRKLVELKSRYPDRGNAKGLFLQAKDVINDRTKSDTDRAIAFYVANKCSFSGLTESSSFSRQASIQNFSMRGINKLPQYSKIIQRWTITNDDYEILLTDLVNAFLYLDPPYEIDSNLYGKKGDMHESFDHDDFAEKCDQRTAKMLISYNSSQLIKDRFSKWSASEYAHTYTMRSVGDYMSKQKERKELLLFNYNREPKTQFSFGSCYNYDRLNSSGLT